MSTLRSPFRTALPDLMEIALKFQMAPNSLFAVLLRSPWWVSALIAFALGLVGMALLPAAFSTAGALSGLPFVVIAVLALRRQWGQPSAAQIAKTQEALARMPWPTFAALLEQAFRRDGYAVQRGPGTAVDFDLERKGRRMVVSARRWKAANTGLEPLRALQVARDTSDAPDALYIGLGPFSENARPFAAAQRITVWQASELAHALRGLPLDAAAPR